MKKKPEVRVSVIEPTNKVYKPVNIKFRVLPNGVVIEDKTNGKMSDEDIEMMVEMMNEFRNLTTGRQ